MKAHTADENGRTRIETLRLFAERTGKAHEDLTPPDLAPEAEYLWRWFREIDARRRGGPISYAEIDAWARLTGRRPTRWEVDAITRIDDAVQHVGIEQALAARPTKTKDSTHARPGRSRH